MIWSKVYIFPVIIIFYIINFQKTDSQNLIQKYGTCFHRISTDFDRCKLRHNERIKFESKSTYKPEEAELAVRKISCCAYWDFLTCVQNAARIHCNDKTRDINIEKYTENVALVPLYVCRDEYPKGTIRCRFPVWLILVIAIAVIVVLTIAVFIFICVRNSR
jgi:hypothetical protein